jgi:hypothetical protein|uniref:Uncharacterized protein n=1 Tax=Myoviridae sp. ctshb19 TaxID=2825194 RepID=A0A8S5UGN6_9CAUD|nr:MAG TPA: hypothetical protein [Myoviridae sp. ctshb19]
MIDYIKNIQRKAWWLIGWSALYVVIAGGYLGYEIHADKWPGPESKFSDLLMPLQMAWVILMALPLVPGTSLNKWVFNGKKK